ncbi:calcium/sodium antiporter [Candidatus Dojkabacteria bacterium]|uniref:Calcium/sodium antiporter n=1 Tax=Candidatus Dojkabacteria bacterium TaxID=2099670 RepID=A0A955L899_9BACT|nr:calcium/sodium antiporter [Candidatus Dojkabacteria bacterium]
MSAWLALVVIAISFYIMAKIVDDYFIKSLDIISKWMKLTPSVAGATLMAMGTSAPELSTALIALFKENSNPGIGLGTVVGSAIFQILVVIGFAALVKTSYLNWKPVIRDGFFYAITIVLLILFVRDGTVTFFESAMLLIGYFVYLVVLFAWTRYMSEEEKNEPDPIELVEEGMEKDRKKHKGKKLLSYLTYPIDIIINLLPDPEKKEKWTIPIFVISLGVIGYFSYWLVVAAEALAGAVGIPSVIIALTILAGGSSIPELIGSVVVSRQGRGDMAISNAIGSNVFDILVSLGLPLFIYSAIHGPIGNIDESNISSSIFLLFATLVAVLALLASQKFKAGRNFGIVLIASYIIYVVAAYTGWI